MSGRLITHSFRQGRVVQSSSKEQHSENILLTRLLGVVPRVALLLLMGVAAVLGVQAFQRQIGDPWSEIWGSLPQLVIVSLTGMLLLVMVQVIERRRLTQQEHTRKFAHIGTGAIAFFAPAFFATHWPVLVLAIIFSAALLVSRHFGWLTSLSLPARRGRGDILFLWAVYLVFLLAEGNSLMFQVPVLVLTVGDAAAALIGRHIGRTRYHLGENTRSVEGSAAFIGVSFLCVLFLLLGLTEMSLVQCAALALLVSTTASAVEALSPRGSDNVSVPIATLFLLETFLR